MAVTGHEDGYVRLFDLGSNQSVDTIKASSDAITSIKLNNDGLTMLTSSHTGEIKLWDMRTQKVLKTTNAHTKKYDEGTLCLAIHPSLPLFASGGADSVIKLYDLSR